VVRVTVFFINVVTVSVLYQCGQNDSVDQCVHKEDEPFFFHSSLAIFQQLVHIKYADIY